MAVHASITRRALLRALPATALALSVPSAMASALPAPSRLPGLIAAHRAALAAYDDAGDACAAASARAGYILERVPLLTAKRSGETFYAHNDEQIELYARQCYPSWREAAAGDEIAVKRAALADRLKAELASIRAENVRREAAENLPALDAHRAETAEREIAARVALLASRPRNAAEAELKAAYLAESEPFRDGWLLDDRDEMRALLALLAQPEGVA